MKTTHAPVGKIVYEKLGKLPSILDEITDKATTLARAFFEKRDDTINSSLFPNLVRYYAIDLLDSEKYKSSGYQRLELANNGLFILYSVNGSQYRIRILKADEDGELPVHNLSQTKREFLTQPDLFPSLPGMEDLEKFVSPDELKIIALWDVDQNYVLSGVQLVCPNGPYGQAYFVEDIPHSATTVTVDTPFEEAGDELDDLDITPRKKTGSDSE